MSLKNSLAMGLTWLDELPPAEADAVRRPLVQLFGAGILGVMTPIEIAARLATAWSNNDSLTQDERSIDHGTAAA